MKRLIILMGSLVLIGAIGVHVYYNLISNPQPLRNVDLESAISWELPGWQTSKVPLAETEKMLKRVNSILNFDQYILRSYRRGTTEVMVYIAYWQPGKISVKEVHTHTPDICWVGSGWRITNKIYEVALSDSEQQPLLPAQARTFEKDSITSYVHYWHIVGDSVYINPRLSTENFGFNSLISMFKYGIDTRKEQFFVRISSNQPMDKVWAMPEFRLILDEIRKLCAVDPKIRTTD